MMNMNISLITARIIKNPIRFPNFNHYFTELHVDFLHMRNYFAHAIVLADGIVGQNIFDIYRLGDYIIIEGECVVIEDIKKNAKLIIYVFDVHPAHLIMK